MPTRKKNFNKPRCFLALSYSFSNNLITETVKRAVIDAGYEVVSLDDATVFINTTIQESILSELASSDCIIADISGRNSNVFFELGLAQAMGKGILIISNDNSINNIPFDIRENRILLYDENELSNLAFKIKMSLLDFKKSPRLRNPLINPIESQPFFIDWERLSPREVENLCQELLAQMGFNRLDWMKGSRDVDLIAELPRKDPDGFEYRELWLISIGVNKPFLHDSEYYIHNLFKYSYRYEELISKDYASLITMLFIMPTKGRKNDEFELLRERIEMRNSLKTRMSINSRLRLWDQDHLTLLVKKYPNIGFKYFSEEGRFRSKTRKSYEDLYKENSLMTDRLTVVVNELEEEKNKRIRAERDSVWKDISFSAAHKIGNPIFAIETDLDPLARRIKEDRENEAIDVVNNIRASVEKAKTIVEQFKSLARSQQIRQVAVKLKPILEEACKSINIQEVECNIECDEELTINADPERIAEGFDELIINATHWFDKAQKQIDIKVINPAPSPLPDYIDSSKEYILIQITDNGYGIQIKEKSKIFEAFYTTHEHGTGLGLAHVRRIIDGHGGYINENGVPGKGANFEIYLPIENNIDKGENMILTSP